MLPIVPDTLLQQRYRILDILGEGGSARTYLATDLSRFDEYCAIKELTPSDQYPAAVAKAKEFFKQEAALLYQLQDPQLPRFWATFEEQNRLFLVQDYIEGETYGQMLNDRRDVGSQFTEAEVWRFLLQILPVVGYIHSQGVIHRDISPENIILRDSDLLPVLIDFGIVQEFANKLQLNPAVRSNASVGKAGYAPIEQLRTGQVYPNSDLYALAVTAIVLLTGKEPSALFASGRMNWDWRKWTQISDGFVNVLQRMLSLEPNNRYQSAVEVFQALQSLNIPNSQPPEPADPKSNRRSELPTVAVGGKREMATNNRVQTAITNLQLKSMWEKPQVFIPVGLLVSILAGVGSWLGVSQLLHRQSPDPVATTPPKQIDFNNPTIPTDDNSRVATTEAIQPIMGQAVTKEGLLKAGTPVKYQLTATGGQNLDIQLIPTADPKSGSSSLMQPSMDGSSPFPALTASPKLSAGSNQPKNPKPTNSTTPGLKPTTTPTGTNQVLMTILSPTGTPIDAQAERVVGWRGQIPSTGEYTIELRPIQGLTGNAYPYKISITQLENPLSSPIPSGLNVPTVSQPPVWIPNPIDQNNPKPTPAIPSPSTPTNSSAPTLSPSQIPIEVPKTVPPLNEIEPERPVRPQRRSQVESEPAPRSQVRERRRTQSNEEDPPKRRRRAQSSEEETPSPRRRRAQSSEEETPNRRRDRPVTPEKQVPIPVPEPESQTTSPPKSAPAMTPHSSDNTTPPPTTTDGNSDSQ